MTPENYYRERSAIICKMRVEERRHFKQSLTYLTLAGKEYARS
jgi:hypothetical protein